MSGPYNKLFDHTLLCADATCANIEKLCAEAVENNFFSVCVNPSYVNFAAKQLANFDVKVCSVVGFPLGQSTTKQKTYEAKCAIKDGADEIDMVMNIPHFRQNFQLAVNEIRNVKKICKKKVLKVIIETALLTDEEIQKATIAVIKGGADFVKTSTGFSYRGVSIKDVQIIKSTSDKYGPISIKASGGIKTSQDVRNLVSIGVNRIGSSRSVEIINQLKSS